METTASPSNKYVKVNCMACGKAFYKKWQKANSKTHTCSAKCRKKLPEVRAKLAKQEARRAKAEAKAQKYDVIQKARHQGKNLTVAYKQIYGKCEVCGKEYEKNSHNQKACSLPCKKELHNKRKRDRLEEIYKNPVEKEKYLKMKREWWKKSGADRYRKKWAEDHNGIRTKKILRNKEIRIGNLIRAKALGLPVYGEKSVWNGKGEWSRDYDHCLECGTTVYIHHGRGVCVHCYEKLKWENKSEDEKERKRFLKEFKKMEYNDSMSVKRAEAKKFIEKARNGEIELTPEVLNLLNNLDNDSSVEVASHDENRYIVSEMMKEEPEPEKKKKSARWDRSIFGEDEDGFVYLKTKKLK